MIIFLPPRSEPNPNRMAPMTNPIKKTYLGNLRFILGSHKMRKLSGTVRPTFEEFKFSSYKLGSIVEKLSGFVSFKA